MHLLFPFLQLLPIFLYAETHYRFKYFFSYLRKHEPEIIADAPHRIEPNIPLPILVLIKDAHLFPIVISRISVVVRLEGRNIIEKNLLESPREINQNIWYQVFNIPLEGVTGWIECDVLFTIDKNNHQRFYRNDNYRTSSHRPLKIFVADSPLPRFEQLHFGECHSHSSFNADQVEFGAPLDASAQLGRAIGLSFQCSTDHSYDLDDSLDNYLVNDPKLPKWNLYQQEVDRQNCKFDNFITIRGEEVTCRNSLNQNIHLLLFGNRNFFWGSGDGAEQWLNTRSENDIPDILNNLESSSIAFAAHPRAYISLLQRLLLNRGSWSMQDIKHKNLSGIQFANGRYTDGFWEGYQLWIKTLLEGDHLFALAGDDAHGNFNRFRQICIPFIKIGERNDQLFGKMRTGVFLQFLSVDNILRALRNGSFILTDGPIANILVNPSLTHISSIGEKYSDKKHDILLEARTSNEYGSIDSLKIFQGYIGNKVESIIASEIPQKCYNIHKEVELEINRKCYIRAEVWTSPYDSSDAQPHFCITNPVWFSPA